MPRKAGIRALKSPSGFYLAGLVEALGTVGTYYLEPVAGFWSLGGAPTKGATVDPIGCVDKSPQGHSTN